MSTKPPTRWAVMWHGCIQWDGGMPLLFHTRKSAAYYIKQRWGYIRNRRDLRSELYNWRMPKPVRVSVDIRPVKRKARKP